MMKILTLLGLARKSGRFGVLAAFAVLLVATHVSAYNSGKNAEATAAEARLAESLQRQIEQSEAIRRQDMQLLMEAVQTETRIIREVRHVEVPDSDCSHLGDDWLRAYNDAIRAASPDPRAPDDAGAPDD